MPKRDICFDAKTRFYTVDKPEGWRWGPAELEVADYIIVRTSDPVLLAELPALRARKRRLAVPDKPLGFANVFGSAKLEDTPEKEWQVPPAYLVLRSGKSYGSEEDMWASVRDGDTVFFTKSPKNPGVPGTALVIRSVAKRVYAFQYGVTLTEVTAWPS